VLGRVVHQNFAGHRRKLDLLAGVPWAIGFAVVLGSVAFEQYRESQRNPADPTMIRPDGYGVSLIYEIRLPPGVSAPANLGRLIELRTPDEIKAADSASVVRKENGDRAVIQGHFRVYKVAPKRVVALRLGDGPTYLFTMQLPPRPRSDGSLRNNWHGPDSVEDKAGTRAPLSNEAIEIRYTASH
jgi:hypothetical protein